MVAAIKSECLAAMRWNPQPGQPPRLTAELRAALAKAIEDGPIPVIHRVVRWRLIDLCQWFWEEHRVVIAKPTLSREVRALGYRKLTARPRHQTHERTRSQAVLRQHALNPRGRSHMVLVSIKPVVDTNPALIKHRATREC
jgi:hypothetical protein